MTAAVACFDAAAFQRLLTSKRTVTEIATLLVHLEDCEPCAQTARGLSNELLADAHATANRLPLQDVETKQLRTLLTKMMQLRSTASTINQATFNPRTLDGPAPEPVVGPVATTIGRYRIVRELGRGGMGTVYEAEDPQLRRRVALKVPQFSGSAEKQTLMRQRFLREARAAAAVDHPNVCKIYDVGEQAGMPFVVMAFVEGVSLADRLTKVRRVNDRSVVALTLRIGEALAAVHAHGIIHRDLKPANILMPKDSTPILTDFGLAHVHADPEQLTGEGALLGTPAYMAPEQATTDLGPVTTRTDLYSLAVVMFQMLTGRLPIEGSAMQIIGHHLAGKPAPSAKQLRPDLDPGLDCILCKAMAHRPEDRYPDVRRFIQVLKDWSRSVAAPAATEPVVAMAVALETPSVTLPPPLPSACQTAVVTATPPGPTIGKPRRRWRWRLTAALLFLAASTALSVIAFRDNQSEAIPQKKPSADGTDTKVPLAGASDEKPQRIYEDFRTTLEEGHCLPRGWVSKSFCVAQDGDRPCLEVVDKTGTPMVTLPRLPLPGDFSVRGEYALDAYSTQKLTIELAGSENKSQLPIAIDARGSVTIANNQPRQSEAESSSKEKIECAGRVVFVSDCYAVMTR